MLTFEYRIKNSSDIFKDYTSTVTISEDVGSEGIHLALKHFLLSVGLHPATVADILNDEVISSKD